MRDCHLVGPDARVWFIFRYGLIGGFLWIYYRYPGVCEYRYICPECQQARGGVEQGLRVAQGFRSLLNLQRLMTLLSKDMAIYKAQEMEMRTSHYSS